MIYKNHALAEKGKSLYSDVSIFYQFFAGGMQKVFYEIIMLPPEQNLQ